jgi:D-glycero-D-manno-heptose 1,7-bisphosphate phosphatase
VYKLAILDRDGVINKPSTAYVKSVEEWRPIPGSIDAIARLTKVGGRIDAIFFCPHLPSANCECRKPKSGMVLDILSRFKVSANEAFMVGDNERDVVAAQGASVKPFIVLTGQGLGNREALKKKLQVEIHDNLSVVVENVLAQKSP